MKNPYSLLACCIAAIVLLQFRIAHTDLVSDSPLKVTAWDAFGYYMYLPSIWIYHDVKELEWLPEIDEKYELTGGTLYQAHRKENGNYVFKYLGGVSIMELPFFLIGHLIASVTRFEADGFSPPYQVAIAFGAVIYCILALFLLRRLLLRYFSDRSTAISVVLLVMATNLIQYVSVDSGMSHAYIFPLYVAVIYTTIRWHSKPGFLWASLTGLTIGLATICRPTEAIMLFIPLLWGTQNKQSSRAKWRLVRTHRTHLLFVVLFGFIGVLPQLIYWKFSSGSFIYDVGSKWAFFNPFFRVLFGWEAGWFIYTPVTILFVLGFLFIKNYPFQKSVLVFCLLNIWIVISWYDWRYGATYSTRALVQSYPVFAFPLTAVVERITLKRGRYAFYFVAVYLLLVNIFQLRQYSRTILHFRDMNRAYYARIYLNRHPSPADMSLLDTREFLKNEKGYDRRLLFYSDSLIHVECTDLSPGPVAAIPFSVAPAGSGNQEKWLKVETRVSIQSGFTHSYINCDLQSADTTKQSWIRLFSPISKEGASNRYVFYMTIPAPSDSILVHFNVSTLGVFSGDVEEMRIEYLTREQDPDRH